MVANAERRRSTLSRPRTAASRQPQAVPSRWSEGRNGPIPIPINGRELGPVRAPELDGAVAWLNTPAPITLAQLRGKIVLLDFWTYGCINCQHVLPDLQRLQAKFADVLVVIGIHAAKFDNERSTENIRRTLQRLGIGHPVANDAQFAIWQAYTVRAWPTQVLIDPRGYVVGTATGEGHGAQLEEVIEAVAAVFDRGGHARSHAAAAVAGGHRGRRHAGVPRQGARR